ncbi:MAG: DUF2493 domain-containing protein [Burkholderiales bacterium]|nr:DUF2493 domain-containing protein [Burkholderiales bacterium]
MVAVRKAWDTCPWQITAVISGGASGVDSLGEILARENGKPIERFPVSKEEWAQHGKAAGPIRNRRMLEAAEALVAVWDGRSPGTLDMITIARKKGIPVHVITHGAKP